MKQTSAELAARLTLDGFPRSDSYDAVWMLENAMGPNPLWLAEALSQVMDLQPGMRVLDLGCGRAITSVFFAHWWRRHWEKTGLLNVEVADTMPDGWQHWLNRR